MNFKSLFSIAAIVVSTCACIAQNELLIMKPGDSIPGVLTVTDSENYLYRYDYHVAPPSSDLVAAIPLTVDYSKSATAALNRFQFIPIANYGRTDVHAVILQLVNSGFAGAVQAENEKTPVRKSMKKILFANRELRNMIYTWMMPYFQKSFSLMSVPEQQGYLDQLNKAKEFTAQLEIEKEKKKAKKAYDYAGDVGYFHAFIYRRLANKELTKEECMQWLDRIIADLSVAKNNNPSPEDAYVIRADHGYGYYTASVYNAWDTYEATYVMRKQKDKFSLVPDAVFDEVNQCGENMLIGVKSNYPDSATYGYLYYDSIGSFYRQTSSQWPSTYVVMKGEGRTARALLFYSPDYYEYTAFDSVVGDVMPYTSRIGVCCIVDIDSGYIIQDSLYLPIVETASGEWGDLEYSYPAANSDYVIFRNGAYGSYGMIGRNGELILAFEYESIEATDDANIYLLNGEEKFDIRTGTKVK